MKFLGPFCFIGLLAISPSFVHAQPQTPTVDCSQIRCTPAQKKAARQAARQKHNQKTQLLKALNLVGYDVTGYEFANDNDPELDTMSANHTYQIEVVQAGGSSWVFCDKPILVVKMVRASMALFLAGEYNSINGDEMIP